MEDEYREKKRSFFFDRLKNAVGNPRDTEIIQDLVEYLIDIGYLRSEQDLEKLLSQPFIKEKLIRTDDYRERLRETSGTSPAEIDISKIRDAEYAKKYREQIKQEIMEQEKNLLREGIESTLFPSVLDAESKEPKPPTIPTIRQDTLWWQDLNLEDDPFPSEEGLSDIADKYYDEIVCRTEVFTKYLELISSSAGEVLKNTIFFGDFGQGKTTLFDYLRKIMIAEPSLHPVYIQLFAELDPYALIAKFKIKLLDELKSIFMFIERRMPETSFAPYDPDPISTQIYQVVDQIRKVSPCEGFVVFVDDLHKLEFGTASAEIFKSIVNFLASLQIFKAELFRKTSSKVAFYVAAVPAWESKLRTAGSLSGSFSRYEKMPAVTIDDAVDMLSRRFAAFAQNKQNPPRIDENLVRRVYNRSKETNEPITWRTFIKSIVYDELQQKHFDVLESSPLSLTEEKKKAIRNLLESNSELKSQLNSLLYGPIESAENRVECIKRLVDTHLKGMIPESRLTALPAESRYFYGRLYAARLIRKRVYKGLNVYVISPELRTANDEVVAQFDLSLEDYMLPIYGTKQLKPVVGERDALELTQLEQLSEKVTNPALKTLLKDASSSYRLVSQRLGGLNEPLDRKLVELATQSVISLTRAWALIEESPEPQSRQDAERFWSESWIVPGAVSEFYRGTPAELLSDIELRYALRLYEQAFAGIANQLVRLYEGSRFLYLPRAKLTRNEMESLSKAHEDFLNGKYLQSLRDCTNLVETRLRTFCFNFFSLLYGRPERRIQRIDDKTAEIIRDTKKKHGYPESNEFEFLNRGQYKNFIAGTDPHAQSNWRELFQYVFAPWNEQTVLDFLNRFAEFNVKTSHAVSSAFRAEEQSEMRRYLGDCVTFLTSMNTAYRRLFTDWHYQETLSTEPRNAHYFCLHKFPEYKVALAPIFVSMERAQALISEFKSKIGVSPFVDLSDWQYVKTVFNCDYREFVAFLSALWKASIAESQDLRVRVGVTKWFGSEAKLEFSEVQRSAQRSARGDRAL